MKKLLVILVLLSSSFIIKAQVEFEKNYDFEKDADEAWCVKQMADDSYIISGASWVGDEGWFDMSLLKIGQNGDSLWSKTYGVGEYNIEVAYEVNITADGGFFIVGGTDGFTGKSDMWAVKTDDKGEIEWSKGYGGDNQEYGHGGIQVIDGYILVGATNSFGKGADDAYIVKLDENGDTVWTKTYGTNQADGAFAIEAVKTGGYIVAGVNNGYTDAFILRLDEKGDTLWTKVIGSYATDEVYNLTQTDDDGFVFVGRTNSQGEGNYDVWLFKLDKDGNLLWEKTYGGEEREVGWSVIKADDGGFFITGMSRSFHHSEEDSDMYLIKTDEKGDTIWTKAYGTIKDDAGKYGIQTKDGGFMAVGFTYITDYGTNFYAVKINKDGILDVEYFGNVEIGKLNIYPNPSSGDSKIEFANPDHASFNMSISDVSGKIVKRVNNITEQNVIIREGTLTKGVYFIDIKNKNKIYNGKLVIK